MDKINKCKISLWSGIAQTLLECRNNNDDWAKDPSKVELYNKYRDEFINSVHIESLIHLDYLIRTIQMFDLKRKEKNRKNAA